MAKNLMSDIKLTLAKCDDVLTITQKVRNSLEPESFVQLTNYKGRFYLKEIDKRTVSIRCVPGNAFGTYYRFVLSREDGSGHIKITLRDFHGDDAFGAMGGDYYRKPLEKLAECVEDNTAKDYLPMSLLKSIDTIKHRLGRFLPMPFFEYPGQVAFFVPINPLHLLDHITVLLTEHEHNSVNLTLDLARQGKLENLYRITKTDDKGLLLERISEQETVLPGNAVFIVNDFVGRLQRLLPTQTN